MSLPQLVESVRFLYNLLLDLLNLRESFTLNLVVLGGDRQLLVKSNKVVLTHLLIERLQFGLLVLQLLQPLLFQVGLLLGELLLEDGGLQFALLNGDESLYLGLLLGLF